MRKLVIKDAEVMAEAICQEIQRSEESRYDHRLHGVLMVARGMNCYDVGRWLGEYSTTIQRWVNTFETHGFSGLQEGERPGRPSRASHGILTQLEKELRQEPQYYGYTQNMWDGKLLSHHLAVRHGVRLRVRQCQRLFRQMGFRQRKPRPLIASADPMQQKVFKKTSPSGKK